MWLHAFFSLLLQRPRGVNLKLRGLPYDLSCSQFQWTFIYNFVFYPSDLLLPYPTLFISSKATTSPPLMCVASHWHFACVLTAGTPPPLTLACMLKFSRATGVRVAKRSCTSASSCSHATARSPSHHEPFPPSCPSPHCQCHLQLFRQRSFGQGTCAAAFATFVTDIRLLRVRFSFVVQEAQSRLHRQMIGTRSATPPPQPPQQ